MFDYAEVSTLFSPEESEIQRAARKVLDDEALPHIRGWWEKGEFPKPLIARLADLGAFGATLPTEWGGAGASNMAYGLVMYELERIDSGLRSFASVQSSLVMYPIFTFGAEEHRRRYLPGMARGKIIGCFGLTEPNGGSDPLGNMKTRARRDGSDWILTGQKAWITNGSIADVALVWARDEHGIVRGFLVPSGTRGFSARDVKHKMSMRASVTSDLFLEDVRIPDSQRLPGIEGLKGPLACLTQARFGIAWGVLGALEAVYTEALAFAQERTTFGKAIASRQLVQEKLVRMISVHTRGLLLAWRLARLKDEGKLKHTLVSLAKRDNVRVALEAARSAREILAASGISLEHHAIRHMLNLETVDTYEGTHDVHTLILGRDITGMGALE